MNVSLSYTLALAVCTTLTLAGRTSPVGDAQLSEVAAAPERAGLLGARAEPSASLLGSPAEPGASALRLRASTGGTQPAGQSRHAGGEVSGRCGSALAGFVNVARRDDTVRLFLNVLHAPPGEHAVRLHQAGDCSAPDAASAGVVWTPHLQALAADSQLGNLGDLHVDDSGRGLLSFSAAAWALGDGSETDLVGRALVIHQRPSELLSTDAVELRIGCAVIALAPSGLPPGR